MALNNTAILTGNMGAEAKIIEKEEKSFATFSLATTDSYKNEKEEWVDKETLWHDILVFSPSLIEQVKTFKKGTRLKVTGSISYRPFETKLEDGRTVKKNEASIIAKKIDLAPLAKKVQAE